LIATLHLIQNNESLRSSELRSQLEVIAGKVRLLEGRLRQILQALSKKSSRRAWGVLLSIRDEETICDTLDAIECDKKSLLLSIGAISAKTTYHLTHWATMPPRTSETATTRDLEGSDQLIEFLMKSSSAVETQLIRASRGAPPSSSQPSGNTSSSNARVSGSRSQNTASQDFPAIDFTEIAKQRAGRAGDLSVGHVVVAAGGTLSRGNVAVAQPGPQADRAFIGNYNIAEEGYLEDQNVGYAAGAWRRTDAIGQKRDEPRNVRDSAQANGHVDPEGYDSG